MTNLPSTSTLITDDQSLLQPDEVALLSQFELAGEIDVLQMISTGHSGARVFLANITFHNSTLQRTHGGPNFVKIDAAWRIREEAYNHNIAASALRAGIPALIGGEIGPLNDRAAIVYAPAAGSVLRVHSLTKLVTSEDYPPEYVADFLREVMNVLTVWNDKPKPISLPPYDWFIRTLNTGSKSHDRPREAAQLGLEITGGTPTRIFLNMIGRSLPNPAVFVAQPELWRGPDRRLTGLLGRLHGDLHGENILCNLTDDNLRPWLIDFARFLPEDSLFYDLAYLEIDIATERLCEAGIEDWRQYLEPAAKALTVPPREYPARDVPNATYRCMLPIRQHLRQIIEGQASTALSEQYQVVWWLTLAGVAMLYARRERYANRPQRLFGYLYAAYALETAFRLLGFAVGGPSQEVDMARLMGEAHINALRDHEIAYAEALIEQVKALDASVVDLEGAQGELPTRPEPRLSDRVRLRLRENVALPLQMTVSGQQRMADHAPRPPINVRETVRQTNRVILLGEPGSGKTALLLRLLLDYARDLRENRSRLIPVFLPLSQYTGRTEADFVTFAQSQMAEYAPLLATRFQALLDSERVILLGDGLNEMPRLTDYALRSVKAVLRRAARVVVTCRLNDYTNLGLAGMEGFSVITLRELTPPLIYQIISQHLIQDQHGHWAPLTDAQKKYLWQDLLRGSDDLIRAWEKMEAAGTAQYFWSTPPAERVLADTQEIPNVTELMKTPTLPGITELNFREREARRQAINEGRGMMLLCRSPYLLTLIIDMYAAKGRISSSAGAIFREYIDSLFEREREDRHRRGEVWPLDHDWHLVKVLARLANEMHFARAANAISRDEAISILEGESTLSLLAHLNLLHDNGASVQFAHSLLQDHFAGYELESAMQRNFPASMYWRNENWWKATPHDYVVMMLLGSYADRPDQVNRMIQWLMPAQPKLVLQYLSSNFTTSQKVPREVKRALIASAQEKANGPLVGSRDAAYRVLGLMHADKRPGTYLREEDGLPDIAWLPVHAAPSSIAVTRPRGMSMMPSFYIGKYPVTYAQYSAFLEAPDGYPLPRWWGESLPYRTGAHRQRWPISNHPVENVSWYAAVAFCRWLTYRLKAAGYAPPHFGQAWEVRLPTEAEWQQAATNGDSREYPYGGAYVPDAANILSVIGQTCAVGIFSRDCAPSGAYDMAGNVYEWTAEYFDTAHSGEDDGKALRVARGGSWKSAPHYASARARHGLAPQHTDDLTGFRVVLAKTE
jgi:hypothetical protein